MPSRSVGPAARFGERPDPHLLDGLDLQINLLAEHELTKLTEVITAIAARLDVQLGAEIEEVKQDVAPEAVLDELDARQEDD